MKRFNKTREIPNSWLEYDYTTKKSERESNKENRSTRRLSRFVKRKMNKRFRKRFKIEHRGMYDSNYLFFIK